MAADSNTGFHQGVMPSKLQNRHMLSFQSGSSIGGPSLPAMRGSINMGNSGQIGGSSGGMLFTGSPSPNGMGSFGGQAGPSSSSASPLGPVDGIRQDSSGLSPEWTIEEQSTLKQGLIKYAGEHSMMKYIKIAAMLRRKTVRDVALRCCWLANGKQRKLDEYYAGKRMYNKKEKTVDSCSSANRFMVNPGASASYSPMMHQVNQNELFSREVPALDGATQQLMDKNSQILHQISTNLATYKVQENFDLFCHTRNNITTILNNMSNMPGIMNQMPPLPVPLNDELLNAILPCPNQRCMCDPNSLLCVMLPRHVLGS